MKTVAVIQPCFVPYAGYFRLFHAADVVVFFDCVQFPRRGWVHRNRFALASGELDWLTLPIAKAPQNVAIADLQFTVDARERLTAATRRFPLLARAVRDGDEFVAAVLDVGSSRPAPYLCNLASEVARRLGMARPTVRSTELALPPDLRKQDRVIAAVRAVGGTRYVNPSGGRELYDAAGFEEAGIELRFLTPYERSHESILARLLAEPHQALHDDIARETILVP